MTDVAPPEFSESLVYYEVTDISVMARMPSDDLTDTRPLMFFSVTVEGKDGKPIQVNYGLSPLEAIRIGVAFGDVAIKSIDALAEKITTEAAKASTPPVVKQRNEPTAYL